MRMECQRTLSCSRRTRLHTCLDACSQDTFGPRFAGSQALNAAGEYVHSQATSDGLNATLEPVMVPQWVRGEEWGRMLLPRNKPLHLVGLGGTVHTPLNASTGRPGILEADVLVVSSIAEMQQQAAQVPGKIVLFNVPFTTYGETVPIRSGGAVAAAKLGAVAALVRSVTPFSLQTPHTGAGAAGGNISVIPNAAVTVEDAEQMARMAERGMRIRVALYLEGEYRGRVESHNVVLTLPGTDLAHEYIVIGGHLDSWDIAEGAMDDGGGAFIGWAALKLMHDLGLRPRRTIMAVMWVDEEFQQTGAAAFRRAHDDLLPNISFALESDEGTFTPFKLGFSGSQAAFDILQEVGASLLTHLSAGNVTVGGGGEDISPLCETGVPCAGFKVLDPRIGPYANNPCLPVTGGQVPLRSTWPGGMPPGGISNGYFWLHHTAADSISHINDTQLRLSSAVMATWAYALASIDAALPRDGPPAVQPVLPLPKAPATADRKCIEDDVRIDAGIGVGVLALLAVSCLTAYVLGVAVGTTAPSGLKHASLCRVAQWGLACGTCCGKGKGGDYRNLTASAEKQAAQPPAPYGATSASTA